MRRRLCGVIAIAVVAATTVLVSGVPAQARAGCSPDPVGDTEVIFADDVPRRARGDLVVWCADYADGLSFSIQAAESSDPATDPNWQSPYTAAQLFVQRYTGDPNAEFNPEFWISIEMTLQGMFAYTHRMSDDVTVCSTGAGRGPSDQYYALDIPASCVGAPEAVVVGARMMYNPSGDEDPEPPFVLDDSEDVVITYRYRTRAVSRLAGADRIATAVAVSQRAFASRPAASVYLARSDVFADSVAAGSLTDGPVLLVPSCGTAPSAVKAEVDRLNPGRVVALGGSGAVCDRLLDDVGAGRSTSRLAGESRVATSAAIARAAFPAGASTVYLARSDVLADAVAAGTLTDGPVVLVPACGDLPPVVADAIRALDPNDVIALGGPSAVCDGMLSQAAAARSTTPASTGRLAGADRYATAAAISARQWNSTTPATAYVARGDVFADAVASGSLADGPVLLVAPCGPLPAAVTAELGRAQPSAIVALGGPAAVCSMTVDIAATDGTPPPTA